MYNATNTGRQDENSMNAMSRDNQYNADQDQNRNNPQGQAGGGQQGQGQGQGGNSDDKNR